MIKSFMVLVNVFFLFELAISFVAAAFFFFFEGLNYLTDGVFVLIIYGAA